ncbi:MAG: ATP-binding protein, partial [Lentilitoribacter sp.]
MRTPLNGIMGVLDLLRTTKLSEKQERYARIAAASSEILLGHANEALDITRIETDSFHLSPQNFDLDDLMTALIEVLEPLAREKQLDLLLQIDDTMRTGFFADSNRIRQILTNLVGNAIKFTSTGAIAIEVKGIHGSTETSLRISVTDTGAGIHPEQYEQIFEDFVALSHSQGRQSRGDGLGLSISRRIARKLGGDITVASEIDVGSTFTLTVPLKRQDTDQEEKTETLTPQQSENIQSMRILVVEDNNINRNVLRDMLEGLGHDVTEAVNGVDCLEQANLQPFDLIFMDISMPVMDGIEATKRLREGQSPNVDTHIVGLTAHGHEEYREKGDQAGMSRFHTKPIRLNALHAILSDGYEVITSHSRTPEELPQELVELCEMLGKDKVKTTIEAFFEELKKFLIDMRADVPFSELDLAEAAHQQKGAAS